MHDRRTGSDQGACSLGAAHRTARLQPEAVRELGLAMLGAVAALHSRGAVHGGLTPERVLLGGASGGVTLLPDPGPEGAGPGGGGVSYLAPEQLAGPRRADERADLWAVGAILYELLAGVPPYRVRHIGELMSALALSEPVPIGVHAPRADASVSAFFARALARDRARRFPTADAMARALAGAAIETAAPAPQTMGGLATTASGEIDSHRPGAALRAPAAARLLVPSPLPQEDRRRGPASAPARRWVTSSIAAVAIVAGLIAILIPRDAGHAAAALGEHARPRGSERGAVGGSDEVDLTDCARVCLVDGPSHRPGAALRGPAEPGLVDGLSLLGAESGRDVHALAPPRRDGACKEGSWPRLTMRALFMCANDAPCVRAECRAPLDAREAR
jgi:hypothetical protein